MGAGALRAKSVIDALGIRSVEDLHLLELIAFERGAIVMKAVLTGAESRLVVGHPWSVITVSTLNTDARRQRFSVAHELGHLELHRHERLFPCDPRSINDWSTKGSVENIEQEANEFAAELLLPEKLFAPISSDIDPSMDAIRELTDMFDVSLMATARRFVEYSSAPCAVVWTERRQIKWFQRNEPFEDLGYFVNVNSVVEKSTVASRYFDGEPVPTASETVMASSWMMEGNHLDLPLSEQCVTMPNYQGVLSLLWVETEWLDEMEDLDW